MLKKKTLLTLLLLTWLLNVYFPAPAKADPVADLYFEAEACYQKLSRNSSWQKYRYRWTNCIEKFQAVYRSDPDGAWAAAGLYMSGKLYYELYRRSGRLSDQKESVDHFERIIKRFPQSAYRPRAEKALGLAAQSAKKSSPKKKQQSTAGGTNADSAKETFHQGEACYADLRGHPQRQKYRDGWLPCIEKFTAVYEMDPDGAWAAAGLYMAGKLYYELYKRSYNTEDKEQALANFDRVVKKFPQSAYRLKADEALAVLAADGDLAKLLAQEDNAAASEEPDNHRNRAPEVAQQQAAAPPVEPSAASGRTMVTGLRFWSNPNYTRLVIDADQETTYSYNLLRKDPSHKKPPRLYVDLHNSRLGKDIERIIPIDDDLLMHARAGQFSHDSVRVVVDIKSIDSYDVFSLREPFRIVMDIRGQGDHPPAPKVNRNGPEISKIDPKKSTKDLARQLNLRISRIVVDPGHGGRDYGAPGYLKGVHEKYITLQIGKELTRQLRQELKCEVFMTRTGDRYLTLEERTAFANTKNADLFISIHTNANRDSRAYGISTYFLNFSDDDESKYVAAMENATSTKNISDLEHILYSLMHYSKISESSRLAAYIQDGMTGELERRGYSRIKSKGVKQAPFYVLMGATMPSILVETSFISNPRECRRLVNPKYQQRLVEGIVKGIKKYIQETESTAFRENGTSGGGRG